jgi:F-type H+-transporting ATPase subunit delta
MTGALASHYAYALADATLSLDSDVQPQQALDQLRSIAHLLSSSEQLQLVLLSPAVPKSDKFMLAERLAEALSLDHMVRNFLLLVVAHGRTREIRNMIAEFERAIDERRGIVPAQVCSGTELTGEQRQELERALSSKLGKPIKARYQVDPLLFGGIKAIVASKEYDTSIRGRLDRLRTQLFADL